MGHRQDRGRGRRTPSSSRTPACSTRSPAPRATRPAPSAPAGAAASCRTSTRTARSTKPSRPPSSRRASSPATSSPPVKSAFGWHVIQIMYGPTDRDQLNDAQDQGRRAAPTSASWPATTPKRPDASLGGDIGWVAKGQFDELATAAIFAAEVGKTSSIVSVRGRRDLPVQGLRGGDPDTRRPAARVDQGEGVRRLVHDQEGRGYHHP